MRSLWLEPLREMWAQTGGGECGKGKQDISSKSQTSNLVAKLKEETVSSKNTRDSSSGEHVCLYKVPTDVSSDPFSHLQIVGPVASLFFHLMVI